MTFIFGNNPLANADDIQEEINRMSYMGGGELRLPPGRIDITRLMFYYHETLNPNYNPEYPFGLIKIIGAGALDIRSVKQNKYHYGTVLYSESYDVVLSVGSPSLGHEAPSFLSKKFEMEGVTVVSINSPCILEAASCPELELKNCTFIQKNGSGDGLRIQSAWYARLARTKVMFHSNSTSTGSGLVSGTSVDAGLFEVGESSLIDGFKYNIRHTGLGKFSNFTIKNSSIQAATESGIRIESELLLLNIESTHFEQNLQHLTTVVPVHVLNMNGVQVSGGFSSNGPNIPRFKFSGGIRTGNVTNINYTKPWSSLIQATSAIADSKLEVRGVNMYHPEPEYYTRDIITCADDGSGRIRVRVNDHGLEDGQRVIIEGVVGSEGANGTWEIVIHNFHHYILVGSIYTTPYISGGKATTEILLVNSDGVLNVDISGVVGDRYLNYNHIRELN